MPCTTDTTAMRNITPMNTPMIEKALLSFCARMVCRARWMASKNGMLRHRAARLFVAERLHGIEPRGLSRGKDTEQQAGECRQAEGEDYGADGYVGRHRRSLGEHQRHEPADRHADNAAHQRQGCRLDQELPQDLAPRGAQRLAHPDLARALR